VGVAWVGEGYGGWRLLVVEAEIGKEWHEGEDTFEES